MIYRRFSLGGVLNTPVSNRVKFDLNCSSNLNYGTWTFKYECKYLGNQPSPWGSVGVVDTVKIPALKQGNYLTLSAVGGGRLMPPLKKNCSYNP